jgi:hypothetical protein
MITTKPILANKTIDIPTVGQPPMTKGTDNPLIRGTVNQTLLFITMLLSREISVPKNPPTINRLTTL